jgi:hypothetical protein
MISGWRTHTLYDQEKDFHRQRQEIHGRQSLTTNVSTTVGGSMKAYSGSAQSTLEYYPRDVW